ERYKSSYAARKILCGRIIDLSFTTGDRLNFEQWFQALGWKDYFVINAPYYVELVKEFYSNLSNVGDSCSNVVEITTEINKVVIKFDDKILGNILGIPAVGSKFFNLPYLIIKNMLRATNKVDGALPYGMVITKIISHFGIVVGNEVPSRIDVGDIYNDSSLKRMGWKRVYKPDEGFVWLPK
ncbi:hypothetical protein CFOL_v3_11685, partial [Cephalotus follicularis]